MGFPWVGLRIQSHSIPGRLRERKLKHDPFRCARVSPERERGTKVALFNRGYSEQRVGLEDL